MADSPAVIGKQDDVGGQNIEPGGGRYGSGFRVTEKPGVTHSMTIAKEDLGLDKVYLVYPGELSFPLRDGMETLGYARIPEFELP